jgi:hypothetical protein
MYLRDRLANLVLLGLGAAAWAAVALLFTTRSPAGDVGVRVTGAALLGSAVGVTAVPFFWLAVFTHRRIAYRGDWLRAARRGFLCGAVVTLLVLLQVLGAGSLPLAVFIVAMAVFVELILTARR